MYNPSLNLSSLKDYLEETFDIPCLISEKHPGTLTLYAANWGVKTTKKFRLSLCESGGHRFLRLHAKLRGKQPASYRALCCAVNMLNTRLHDEVPGSLLYVMTDRRVRLDMCVPIASKDAVSDVLVHAFHLLVKYGNALGEELQLLIDEEDEPSTPPGKYDPVHHAHRSSPFSFFDPCDAFQSPFDCEPEEELFDETDD